MSLDAAFAAVLEAHLAPLREELRAVRAELEAMRTTAPATSETMLTVEQVAERAGGVKPETVRGWIHRKELGARRAGHRWVVKPADLERFLARDTAEGETIEPEEHLRLLVNRAAGGKRR